MRGDRRPLTFKRGETKTQNVTTVKKRIGGEKYPRGI